MGFAILPSSMTPTAIYSKNPDFVQRDVAGECILVPIRRRLTEVNSIYVLNETGASLWNRIDGKRSIDQIMTDFCEEFEVGLDQLAQDSTTLLNDLLSIEAIKEIVP